MSPEEALKLAIAEAGGPAAVAREFNVRPQAVSQWVTADPTRCRKLAELSKGKVSVHDLRPDVFGTEQAAA
jgi:DNA-binding transcriptional regulator YdaS (Cro superfamily)